MSDEINHPSHYTQGKIECIEVLEDLARQGVDFRLLWVIKYIWRANLKGERMANLEKARWFLNRVIAEESEALEESTDRLYDPDIPDAPLVQSPDDVGERMANGDEARAGETILITRLGPRSGQHGLWEFPRWVTVTQDEYGSLTYGNVIECRDHDGSLRCVRDVYWRRA